MELPSEGDRELSWTPLCHGQQDDQEGRDMKIGAARLDPQGAARLDPQGVMKMRPFAK
jgi:hypothetical protein